MSLECVVQEIAMDKLANIKNLQNKRTHKSRTMATKDIENFLNEDEKPKSVQNLSAENYIAEFISKINEHQQKVRQADRLSIRRLGLSSFLTETDQLLLQCNWLLQIHKKGLDLTVKNLLTYVLSELKVSNPTYLKIITNSVVSSQLSHFDAQHCYSDLELLEGTKKFLDSLAPTSPLKQKIDLLYQLCLAIGKVHFVKKQLIESPQMLLRDEMSHHFQINNKKNEVKESFVSKIQQSFSNRVKLFFSNLSQRFKKFFYSTSSVNVVLANNEVKKEIVQPELARLEQNALSSDLKDSVLPLKISSEPELSVEELLPGFTDCFLDHTRHPVLTYYQRISPAPIEKLAEKVDRILYDKFIAYYQEVQQSDMPSAIKNNLLKACNDMAKILDNIHQAQEEKNCLAKLNYEKTHTVNKPVQLQAKTGFNEKEYAKFLKSDTANSEKEKVKYHCNKPMTLFGQTADNDSPLLKQLRINVLDLIHDMRSELNESDLQFFLMKAETKDETELTDVYVKLLDKRIQNCPDSEREELKAKLKQENISLGKEKPTELDDVYRMFRGVNWI